MPKVLYIYTTNKNTIYMRYYPILKCFYHLLWLHLLIVSEFSCFAKSYSVSGLTPLPHIPNRLHSMQKSAHEVLEANWEARVMPGLTEKSFVLSICD